MAEIVLIREMPALFFKGSIGDELNTIPIVRALARKYNTPVYVKSTYGDQIFKNNPCATLTPRFTVPFLLSHPGPEESGLHLIDCYARQAGVSIADRTLALVLDEDDAVPEFDASNGSVRVAVDTRCGWPSRTWPLRSFKVLTHILTSRNVQVVEVGKFFSNCYGEPVESVLSNATVSYVNRLTLRQTASVLSQCDAFVGCDSGLAHMAVAVGTPAVTLFGPIHPSVRAHALTVPVFSGGCGDAPCGQTACLTGRHVCMRSITPEHVAATVLRVLFRKTKADDVSAAC